MGSILGVARQEIIPSFAKDKQLYYNTLFLVNDKIIFGSRIISAVIKLLKKKKTANGKGSAVSFQMDSLVDSGGGEKWTPRRNKDRADENVLTYANKIKISYSASLDLSMAEVLSEALKR